MPNAALQHPNSRRSIDGSLDRLAVAGLRLLGDACSVAAAGASVTAARCAVFVLFGRCVEDAGVDEGGAAGVGAAAEHVAAAVGDLRHPAAEGGELAEILVERQDAA
jgi:hypothetical protein